MPANSPPVLLWDIDGTLLAAGTGGLEYYHEALQATVPDAALPVTNTHGKTDWQNILELLDAAQLSRDLGPQVSAQLDRLAEVFLTTDKLTILPGVPEVLARCRKAGFKNGLLTGNSERRSRTKLGGAGLDLDLIDWNVSFFGARSEVRSDLTVAARAALPHTPLLVIGDTPFDGHAAAVADIGFVAVCTGAYERDAFAHVNTLAIIDDLDTGLPAILQTMQ